VRSADPWRRTTRSILSIRRIGRERRPPASISASPAWSWGARERGRLVPPRRHNELPRRRQETAEANVVPHRGSSGRGATKLKCFVLHRRPSSPATGAAPSTDDTSDGARYHNVIERARPRRAHRAARPEPACRDRPPTLVVGDSGTGRSGASTSRTHAARPRRPATSRSPSRGVPPLRPDHPCARRARLGRSAPGRTFHLVDRPRSRWYMELVHQLRGTAGRACSFDVRSPMLRTPGSGYLRNPKRSSIGSQHVRYAPARCGARPARHRVPASHFVRGEDRRRPRRALVRRPAMISEAARDAGGELPDSDGRRTDRPTRPMRWMRATRRA
jgi:hypothetical protein